MKQTDNISLAELIHTIAEERGLDLRGYKPSTLERRVRKRMYRLGAASFCDYLEKVRQNPGEINDLLNTVLINVTEFFRDPQAWDCLRNEIPPHMLGRMKPGDSFRAWCAGCASGEEAFSLAILVADYFGPLLNEYEVKIYATDVDEDALNTARKGEYAADRLRRVRPNWVQEYFTGQATLKVNRDIRRMVIFGRSNLVSDAPISHCDLVICRNVLIYFDAATQKQILARLHYALDPGGVLFLGKAESKLTESKAFRMLNSRWRIFQKDGLKSKFRKPEEWVADLMSEGEQDKHRQELERLQLEYRYLLDTLKSGVLTLDSQDIITNCNERALEVWGVAGARVGGKRIQTTELAVRCPEILSRLEDSRGKAPETVSFDCQGKIDGEEHVIAVTIRPVLSEQGGKRIGTILYFEDVTPQGKLQNTIQQLEATSEELQSANEELETTNEELQSTNEELETTNEELQSTNEELETTNEELQSLNEELENMNDELEQRTRELNSLTARYAETLKRLPWPVMLVDSEEKIQLWNASAQKLFGVGMTSVAGVGLDQLPVGAELRKTLVRRCRSVLEKGQATTLRNQSIGNGSEEFDIQFTPISSDDAIVDGVMVMFGPFQSAAGIQLVKRANNKKESVSKRPAKKAAKGKAATARGRNGR